MASFDMSDVASFDGCFDGPDELGDLLSTNWQTTAAVGLTVATGGVAGAIMLSALPAQTLATGAGIGLLAYAGKRRANGEPALPDFPFMSKKSEEKTESDVKATEPVAA